MIVLYLKEMVYRVFSTEKALSALSCDLKAHLTSDSVSDSQSIGRFKYNLSSLF